MDADVIYLDMTPELYPDTDIKFLMFLNKKIKYLQAVLGTSFCPVLWKRRSQGTVYNSFFLQSVYFGQESLEFLIEDPDLKLLTEGFKGASDESKLLCRGYSAARLPVPIIGLARGTYGTFFCDDMTLGLPASQDRREAPLPASDEVVILALHRGRWALQDRCPIRCYRCWQIVGQSIHRRFVSFCMVYL